MNLKVLFLCTELAGYFNACISYLKQHTDSSIKVYHWPKASSAPFQHDLPGIELIEKAPHAKNSLLPAIIEFNPAIIYVGGWVDKDYLLVAKHFKEKGIPVVCGLDNPWKGSLRQHISALVSYKIVKPYFTHMWVAGSRQYEFARRMGFSHRHIIHDLYIADIDLFGKEVKSKYNKVLLYVGRLEKVKGIDILYNAFSSLSAQQRNGWKLTIVGNGSLQDSMRSNEIISVEPFMQPEELKEYSKDAGGFILPSIKEPWGVVVQEFAAAQLPLILSDEVNAGEKYLIHQYNGFQFRSNDKNDLKHTLIRFFQLTMDELEQMGKRSHKLAMANDHELWVSRFLSAGSNVN